MNNCDFFNCDDFPGPMIYDSSFTSEYEKYVDWLHRRFYGQLWIFRTWWFCLDQWFDSPFTSECEKYIVKCEMIDFIDVWWTVVIFFNCDDFVWTNDLWFLIYIWIWKIRREFWLDRLHWCLNEQLWFFQTWWWFFLEQWFYDSPFTSECENTSWNLKW